MGRHKETIKLELWIVGEPNTGIPHQQVEVDTRLDGDFLTMQDRKVFKQKVIEAFDAILMGVHVGGAYSDECPDCYRRSQHKPGCPSVDLELPR